MRLADFVTHGQTHKHVHYGGIKAIVMDRRAHNEDTVPLTDSLLACYCITDSLYKCYSTTHSLYDCYCITDSLYT